MNMYLVALIGTVAVFAVGFVFYGLVFKDSLKDVTPDPTPTHLTAAVVGIYIAALLFTLLFSHVSFSDVTGLTKGVYLGLLTGVGFFAAPLYVDSSFFKVAPRTLFAVLLNWIIAFIVLGLVVAYLA